MKKKRIVVICPGRGTYTKESLGYLKRAPAGFGSFIKEVDAWRAELGQPTISELDGADVFKTNLHTKGEHASPLIYACSALDFASIDRERFEIVAVTGNSMGWYLTLAFAGALDRAAAFEVINTMGGMMKDEVIGGQVIYPVVDENWRASPERERAIREAVQRVNAKEGHEVYDSIYLGGYLVLGANKPGVAALLKELPAFENYPFQLINHAAFHTPLLRGTSARAFETISPEIFQRPAIPMIDGRGVIWTPYGTDRNDLYAYTLGTQVHDVYDFSRAIGVALKEFAPDHLVLLGPGSTLGGSIGQILIANDWGGLKDKAAFSARQAKEPMLLAMDRPEQRPLVVSPN